MSWWLLVSLSGNAEVLAVAEADHTHAVVSEARMWTDIVFRRGISRENRHFVLVRSIWEMNLRRGSHFLCGQYNKEGLQPLNAVDRLIVRLIFLMRTVCGPMETCYIIGQRGINFTSHIFRKTGFNASRL